MDERQELTAGKAAMITLFFITMGALIWLAWEYFTTGAVHNTTGVVLLVGSGALFSFFQHLYGAEAPRGFLGQELPTGTAPEERRVRLRSYLGQSLALALAMLALGIIGYFLAGDRDALDSLFGLPLPLEVVIGLVLSTGVFFLISWLIGESEARAVERRLARLEG